MDISQSEACLEVLNRKSAASVVAVSAEAAEPLRGDLVHLQGGKRCGTSDGSND